MDLKDIKKEIELIQKEGRECYSKAEPDLFDEFIREDIIELVDKAIKSALNQTYDNIEVIAVDNKSTDNTYFILQEFAAKHNNLKIFQNERNLGPVKNWRKCLDYSSGEFIKILFSDDWIDETYIEKCMNILLPNENVGFVFSSVRIHSNKNEKIHVIK